LQSGCDDACRAVGGGASRRVGVCDGKAGVDGLACHDLIGGRGEHQGVERSGDHGGGAGVGIDARHGTVTAAA
jgi:hypothetical protein